MKDWEASHYSATNLLPRYGGAIGTKWAFGRRFALPNLAPKRSSSFFLKQNQPGDVKMDNLGIARRAWTGTDRASWSESARHSEPNR
jgi:hypothetical protein